ncbi:hypothetical protein HYH03_000155 [Edaphochlamys debaryana]|uniref:Uncharacterized protein n=1 Tax=Edaphochlamys debaryana TaxID=47281 RepID=A0A835YIP7_9CHLO|nr:hypothetical protein HYH03_000155 [Edaphochlamys debaryana]|eukprot:KAG2501651.1 hypothetical protein HYH03_000155 [Edaphochlamys debaryana]
MAPSPGPGAGVRTTDSGASHRSTLTGDLPNSMRPSPASSSSGAPPSASRIRPTPPASAQGVPAGILGSRTRPTTATGLALATPSASSSGTPPPGQPAAPFRATYDEEGNIARDDNAVLERVVSAVERLTRVKRQAPPALVPPPPGEGDPDSAPPTPPPPPPIGETITTSIEAAAPGSTLGGPLSSDPLDALVNPPALDRANGLVDYAQAADRWLMTEPRLEVYEEYASRGLLMIRNISRTDPRFPVTSHPHWVGILRDCMGSKHALVRAAAASAVSAYAASAPGRDALQRDPQALERAVAMLRDGIKAGCDNLDTQYGALALSTYVLNPTCKQQLLRLGAMPLAAEVLRFASRYCGSHLGTGAVTVGGAGGGGGAGTRGGRLTPQTVAVLRTASFVASMLTGLVVDTSAREQMSLSGVPRLASELQERCAVVLGPDAALSRRLALLAATQGAAEVLEELMDSGEGGMGVAWDLIEGGVEGRTPSRTGGAGSNPLQRGVSFLEGGRGMAGLGRAVAAMGALHRMQDTPEPAPSGGGGGGGTASRPVTSTGFRTGPGGEAAGGGGGGMGAGSGGSFSSVAGALARTLSLSKRQSGTFVGSPTGLTSGGGAGSFTSGLSPREGLVSARRLMPTVSGAAATEAGQEAGGGQPPTEVKRTQGVHFSPAFFNEAAIAHSPPDDDAIAYRRSATATSLGGTGSGSPLGGTSIKGFRLPSVLGVMGGGGKPRSAASSSSGIPFLADATAGGGAGALGSREPGSPLALSGRSGSLTYGGLQPTSRPTSSYFRSATTTSLHPDGAGSAHSGSAPGSNSGSVAGGLGPGSGTRGFVAEAAYPRPTPSYRISSTLPGEPGAADAGPVISIADLPGGETHLLGQLLANGCVAAGVSTAPGQAPAHVQPHPPASQPQHAPQHGHAAHGPALALAAGPARSSASMTAIGGSRASTGMRELGGAGDLAKRQGSTTGLTAWPPNEPLQPSPPAAAPPAAAAAAPRSACSSPLATRHASQHRIDLPFHLVRPQATTTPGKMSRITAAYGHHAGGLSPSVSRNGREGPASPGAAASPPPGPGPGPAGLSRMYTSEL